MCAVAVALGLAHFHSRALLLSSSLLVGRANGYARSVPSPPAGTVSYTVHDVIVGKDIGTVAASGKFTAVVDKGDTRVFVLTPAETSRA
jgi:hypothetical protein